VSDACVFAPIVEIICCLSCLVSWRLSFVLVFACVTALRACSCPLGVLDISCLCSVWSGRLGSASPTHVGRGRSVWHCMPCPGMAIGGSHGDCGDWYREVGALVPLGGAAPSVSLGVVFAGVVRHQPHPIFLFLVIWELRYVTGRPELPTRPPALLSSPPTLLGCV